MWSSGADAPDRYLNGGLGTHHQGMNFSCLHPSNSAYADQNSRMSHGLDVQRSPPLELGQLYHEVTSHGSLPSGHGSSRRQRTNRRARGGRSGALTDAPTGGQHGLSRTLYFEPLRPEVNEQTLRMLLLSFGPIFNIQMHEGWTSAAFVTFTTTENATRCLSAMAGTTIMGVPLRVTRVASPVPPPASNFDGHQSIGHPALHPAAHPKDATKGASRYQNPFHHFQQQMVPHAHTKPRGALDPSSAPCAAAVPTHVPVQGPKDEADDRSDLYLAVSPISLTSTYPHPSAGCVNFYIQNISREVDDEMLERVFGRYGALHSVRVLRNVKGRSRGCGFVCFRDANDAREAFAALADSVDILGPKPLRMDVAASKEERLRRAEAGLVGLGALDATASASSSGPATAVYIRSASVETLGTSAVSLPVSADLDGQTPSYAHHDAADVPRTSSGSGHAIEVACSGLLGGGIGGIGGVGGSPSYPGMPTAPTSVIPDASAAAHLFPTNHNGQDSSTLLAGSQQPHGGYASGASQHPASHQQLTQMLQMLDPQQQIQVLQLHLAQVQQQSQQQMQAQLAQQQLQTQSMLAFAMSLSLLPRASRRAELGARVGPAVLLAVRGSGHPAAYVDRILDVLADVDAVALSQLLTGDGLLARFVVDAAALLSKAGIPS